MTVTVKHASLTGAAANPDALVDGPAWDADHTITGLDEALALKAGLTSNTFTGQQVVTNSTDITVPSPAYTPASGAVQIYGGLSVYKTVQFLGGVVYVGDGTNTGTFTGTVVANYNSYNAGASAGAALDFDHVGVQKMTIGQFGAVTNGLVSGVYNDTPTWKTNRSSGIGIRFTRHLTNSTVSDLLYLNADQSVTMFGALTVPNVVGTTTNDDAAAGSKGEYISSTVLQASAVSLTSLTAADVASISLTAGDWDISGNTAFLANAVTTSTEFGAWISTTTASFPTAPNNGAYSSLQVAHSAGKNPILTTGTTRIKLAATTTVYLSCYSIFAVNTMKAYGFIGARRVR